MMYRVKVTNFNLRNEATYTLVRDSSYNADLIPIINSQTHTMLQLTPAEANDLVKY